MKIAELRPGPPPEWESYKRLVDFIVVKGLFKMFKKHFPFIDINPLVR
jgi:hypothetical protein